MNRSTERILTTHVGSLPRPADLIRTMFAKQEGVPIDPVALEQRTRAAVAEVVAKQLRAGVDVVSDGEMSKPSYVTYISDRLDGFGGTSQPLTYADLVDFPELQKKVFGDPGRSRRRTPACNAEIEVRDPEAARVDVEHLKAALPDGQEAFLNAASPGVIALFFRNDHYATREEYLFAIAEAMRVEYEAVTGAGILVQIDCPDLGDGPPHPVRRLHARAVPRRGTAATSRRSTTPPATSIPSCLRMHVCWGNYEGPHHCDVPFADIVDLVFTRAPERDRLRGRQPAPRARVADLRGRAAARGQGADPGRARVQGQLHRAPRADRAAHPPLRRPRRARERAGRQRLRLRHLGRPGRRRSRRGVGEARRAQRGRRDRVTPARY